MWKLALKSVMARKVKLGLLCAIIMTSVGFITGTFIFTDSISKGFGDLFGTVYKDTAAVVRGQKIATDAEAFDSGSRNLVPQAILEKASTAAGVSKVDGALVIFMSVLDKAGKPIEIGPPTFGRNWIDSPAYPYKVTEGRAPTKDGEMVISRILSKKGSFKVGDDVKIAVGDKPETFKVVGVATFGSADGSTLDMMFDEKTAFRLSGRADGFNELEVVAKAGVSQEAVRNSVKTTLNDPRYDVVTGKQITAETSKTFQDLIGGLAKILLGFGLIALLVGVFVIYNTFSILIAQRQRELALLRAVGASRRQVLSSVLAESVVIGAIGSALGLAFGVVAAKGLQALFALFGSNPPGAGLIIDPRTIIVGIAAGMVATVFSALAPALRASSVPPVAAIRSAALDTSGNSRIRGFLGALVIAGGAALLAIGLTTKKNGIYFAGGSFLAVVVGVAIVGPVLVKPLISVLGAPLPRFRGMAGTLARQNAVRNPRRTSSSSLALTIGVAVVAFFMVVGASIKASVNHLIDNQFTADYIVRTAGSGGPGGLSADVANQVSSVKGVKESTGLRFAIMSLDNKATPIVGANPATVGDLFDFGKVDGKLTDLTGDSIAVLTKTAVKKGWKVGTTLQASMETGPVPLKVVALFEKNDAINAQYLVGLPLMTTRAPSVTQDAAVVLKLAPGADQKTIGKQLDTIIKDYPTLSIQDRAAFKASQSGQVNQILAFVTILLFLAIIIALVGIAITLSLSIFERIRELGVLRAIGQQRAQTRSTVRWESVLISVLGTVVGLLIGTAFGAAIIRAARDSGFNTIAIPPFQLILVTVLGALAGVAASVFPAYKASNTDIMAALAHS
jgi:putative ABC transport system permease protein